jgi:hypothetical protein
MLIPSLLGIKKDRFWILARALRECQAKRETITSKIVANILFKNTEEILIAIAKNKSHDVNQILKTHRSVRQDIETSGMTKQEYLHDYYKDDQENKVYKRYLRAYPKKKA